MIRIGLPLTWIEANRFISWSSFAVLFFNCQCQQVIIGLHKYFPRGLKQQPATILFSWLNLEHFTVGIRKGLTEWILGGGSGVCKWYFVSNIWDARHTHRQKVWLCRNLMLLKTFHGYLILFGIFLRVLLFGIFCLKQSNSDQWWQSQWLVVISWLKEARESEAAGLS